MQNNEMGDEQIIPGFKGFIEKIKKYKKEIFIVGISIATVVGIVLLVKNRAIIKNKAVTVLFKKGVKINVDNAPIIQTVIENVVEIDSIEKVVEVNKHLRNLPAGHSASIIKMLTASKNGFQLENGQTWVDSYSKMCA
jgi:hypothetical protein